MCVRVCTRVCVWYVVCCACACTRRDIDRRAKRDSSYSSKRQIRSRIVPHLLITNDRSHSRSLPTRGRNSVAAACRRETPRIFVLGRKKKIIIVRIAYRSDCSALESLSERLRSRTRRRYQTNVGRIRRTTPHSKIGRGEESFPYDLRSEKKSLNRSN